MRVKRGVKSRKRRTRILQRSEGFRGRARNTLKMATEKTERGMQHAYAGRRIKRRDFRSLWIVRINAAARENGMSYSVFMSALKKANISIDRKILAGLAFDNPVAFKAIADSVKSKQA
ncbi:MAG: 50S ribosomal protein L20 [Deltaproteobacteria bacterium]|jgi:large subunit ribosomal protein L20|nr:50S ribosomal protein L20 [Deltaproteobacteria bacterium]